MNSALAIGSKFERLVIIPKVPHNGTYKRLDIIMEKAAVISG